MASGLAVQAVVHKTTEPVKLTYYYHRPWQGCLLTLAMLTLASRLHLMTAK